MSGKILPFRAKPKRAAQIEADYGVALTEREAKRLANAQDWADRYIHAAAQLLHEAVEEAATYGLPLPRTVRDVVKEYRDDLNDIGVALVARVWPGECA